MLGTHSRPAAAYREVPTSAYRTVVDEATQLVDVRQPGEFAGGSLPGAVNLPLHELAVRLGELDPDRRVVLVCRSGARSGAAAEFLAAAGFGDVVNLAGGMLAHRG